MGTRVDWVAGLSPWPSDGFGLARMHRLMAVLGEPQRDFESIHVVGTNGKSTATLTIEALLRTEGLSTGATVSPHVRHWSERILVDGLEVDLELALDRIYAAALDVAATQFETITAAAFCEFSAVGVDVAVIEAGLGGRHDATNVVNASVVLLTNVGLDHTEVLGETIEAIATEKLAVATAPATVILPEPRFAPFVPAGCTVRLGGAAEAAEAFCGRSVGPPPRVSLPGRLERRGSELRDGAHNPDGVRWLVEHLLPEQFVICASILADKDVESMLAGLSLLGDTFVATTSSNDRALGADELATHAHQHFARVVAVPGPVPAVERAHELGEPVLVTGSLYLLADLAASESA